MVFDGTAYWSNGWFDTSGVCNLDDGGTFGVMLVL